MNFRPVRFIILYYNSYKMIWVAIKLSAGHIWIVLKVKFGFTSFDDFPSTLSIIYCATNWFWGFCRTMKIFILKIVRLSSPIAYHFLILKKLPTTYFVLSKFLTFEIIYPQNYMCKSHYSVSLKVMHIWTRITRYLKVE